jgi:hypothetical protein
MKRPSVLFAALVLSASLAAPRGAAAADPTIVTGGAGGTYPPATNFTGVAINGIEAGFGAEVGLGASGLGQFCVTLLGVSSLGLEQNIKLEGEVTTASQPAPNVAILSGTATIDMGDGLPPADGIPFTATVATDASGLGTIGLVTGLASLPDARMDVGSLTIR